MGQKQSSLNINYLSIDYGWNYEELFCELSKSFERMKKEQYYSVSINDC